MKTHIKILTIVIAVMMATAILSVSQATHLASKDFAAIKVACVGDSITEISGYPSELQSLLGCNYMVENFGSSGSTVSLNSWKPYMDQPEFQKALQYQPNIVIIMLGTNDDLMMLHSENGTFQTDYTKLISQFQQLQSKPQIFIVKPPPIFSNSTDLSSSYMTQTIIPQIQQLANNLNLPLIDVFNAFGNHADYFLDGVHPNTVGAQLISNTIYKGIISYK